MRHAQATSAPPAGGDRERPLSDQGRGEALAAGRMLAELGVRLDLALVSDARRTRQTWDGVAEGLAEGASAATLEIEPGLYNAGSDILRRHVEDAEARCDTLILIVHNPGVHQLAFDLLMESAASEAVLDRVRAGFAPGTAILFQVDAAGRCTYDGLIPPQGAARP